MLDELRFSTTVEQTHLSALKSSFWEISKNDKTELAQVEISHAERVANFRDFILEVTLTSDIKVVIGIDELDKITRGEDAIALINGIKDLMHIPGCHFAVSVSEDALSSFALRGVPVRDVFDSTFDLVLPVQRLTPLESVLLIQKRVIDFPYLLTLACHVLSGGLPRDLIRAVRQCVDYRRSEGSNISVRTVVQRLIVDTALSVLDASVDRLSKAQGTDVVSSLFSIRTSLVQAKCETSEALEALSGQFAAFQQSEGPDRFSTASMAYFVCLTTTYRYFEQILAAPVPTLEYLLNSDQLLMDIHGLAEAFAVLAKSPIEAISRSELINSQSNLR